MTGINNQQIKYNRFISLRLNNSHRNYHKDCYYGDIYSSLSGRTNIHPENESQSRGTIAGTPTMTASVRWAGASPPSSTVGASPDTIQTVTETETALPATGRTTKEITGALIVTITDQAGTVEEAASRVEETLNVRVDRTRIVISEVAVVTTEDMIAVTAEMTNRNSLEATMIKAAMTSGTIHRPCRITGDMAGRVVISNMHIQTVTGSW